MTDDARYEPIPVRLDFETLAGPFSRALASLDAAATRGLDAACVEAPLRELLRIRASQLNGCAYCVDMHTRDARRGGETWQRITAVAVWEESGCFTRRERAALAFTETVTLAAKTRVPDAAFDAIRLQFSPEQIASLVALLVAINAWNTIGVTTRTWPVDSTAPYEDH